MKRFRHRSLQKSSRRHPVLSRSCFVAGRKAVVKLALISERDIIDKSQARKIDVSSFCCKRFGRSRGSRDNFAVGAQSSKD